ncbi:Uncharacterised protein [uncultured archaeon]|nr:Uncharacterised protein [uncultured archaeon]
MEPEKMLDETFEGMRAPSTLLLPLEAATYSRGLADAMESFMQSRKGDAVYLTFNKPAAALADIFKNLDHKNRLLFLDVISTHNGERASDMENAFFVSFPGDLTGVMVALSRTLKMHPFRFLFLDSLSSLLIYNDERTATRFIHALSAMCKQYSVHMVLISCGDIPDSFAGSISSLATAQLALS